MAEGFLPSRARGGRPAYEKNDDDQRRVQVLVAAGIKQDVIAKVIGVSDVTLRKYYAEDLDYGKEAMIGKVANSLIEKALSDRPDAVNAAKFFLQSQGGWTERSVTEVDVTNRTVTDLSEAEWRSKHLPEQSSQSLN